MKDSPRKKKDKSEAFGCTPCCIPIEMKTKSGLHVKVGSLVNSQNSMGRHTQKGCHQTPNMIVRTPK